jgi:hypothetical protein
MTTATFTKFNQFTNDLMAKVHNLGSDSLKVALTNTLPVASNAVLGSITQIANGNGYTTGGTATTPTLSTSGGVSKLVCSDVVFTATGSVGPFQYAVLYNDTPTSPTDPLIGWYDYGSAVTMSNTQTFTVDFDGTNGVLTFT